MVCLALSRRKVSMIATAVGLIAVGAAAGMRLKAQPPEKIGCSASVYQTPAPSPPKEFAPLVLGPVVFNHLAPLDGASRPTASTKFYSTGTVLNVLARARHGAVVAVQGIRVQAALFYGSAAREAQWEQDARRGRLTLADIPHSVTFAVCHDPSSRATLNTQYSGGIAFDHPGCVALTVRAKNDSRVYHATVRLLVNHC
jgi:hypothetical protein